MPPTEAAVRRAGALMALAAASALTRLPAAKHAVLVLVLVLVLALHAVFLLGCAAVQLSPAHRAVAGLARRAAEAARGETAAGLRWAGFGGIVLLCPLYVAGDVRTEAAALDRVEDFILYLMFLGGVWAIYLSMVTGRGAPPPLPVVAVAAEGEKLDGGEVNGVAPQSARALVELKV